MQERRDGDEELAFDIGFALWRSGVKLDINTCRSIAARVIAHLKLSRWRFTRLPPEQMHGTFKKSDERE